MLRIHTPIALALLRLLRPLRARAILIACSEIENCLNSFARDAKYKPRPSSIGKYQEFIAAMYPLLVTMKIDFRYIR